MDKIEKHIDTIRLMSRFENELLNHRLGWLSSLQGLLFASLAFAWGKGNVSFLTIIICLIGIIVSISIGVSTAKANKAIVKLQEKFDKLCPDDYQGPDLQGDRIGSTKSDCLLPANFIPWVFGIGWLLILLLKIALIIKSIYANCS